MTHSSRTSLLKFTPHHVFPLPHGFSNVTGTSLAPGYRSRLPLSARVPTVLSYHSTGISTCCPSATTLVLTLGPDLPRADQLYPGNLRYSALKILTSISLLIPAFSLLSSPPLLPVWLRSANNAPLPTFLFLSFGVVFQPRTFSAQDLSTSELLRTLLMCGCF